MATKIIKEIVTDVGGNTTIEFSDDTTQKYNVADVVTAQVNPVTGGISLSGINTQIALAAKNTMGQKLMGISGVTDQTSPYTYLMKVALDADFDSVRVVYYHHGTGSPVITACVAATETAQTDTTDHLFEPIAGGVKYQVKDSATDDKGWRSVLWAGAASPTVVAASNSWAPTISASDWIPLQSVPRADGGTLPLLMLRLYSATAAAQPYSKVSCVAAMRDATAANNGRILQSAAYSGDAVGTISDAARPGSLASSCPTVGIQFRTRSRGLVIVGVGDSITQGDGQVADLFSSWGLRAAAKLSTAARPVSYWNNGVDGKTSSFYLPSGLNTAVAVAPNIMVYSAYSPNDYGAAPTAGALRYAVQTMMAKTQAMLDYCYANNITPILTTGNPHSAQLTTVAVDDVRKVYNAKIRAMCAAKMAYLADWDLALSDGASPAAYLPAYDVGDHLHPNEAAIEVMANVLAATVRTIF